MCTRSSKVAIALAATIATGAAHGSVILSDSFNGRTNGDASSTPQVSSWGSNDNALGGSVVQSYETSNPFNATIARVQNNYGELGWAFAEIQHDFAANVGGGGLTWEFKVNFPGTAGGHTSWWLGTASTDIGPSDISVAGKQIPLQMAFTDLGLIMRAAGGWTFTNHGVASNGGTEVNFTPVVNPRGQDNTVRIDILTTGAASVPGTMKLTVNGIVQDINGAAPGTDFAFTWDAQGELYGGFGSNVTAYYLVDDLVVSAVPEPGAIGALAAGLLLLKRRRAA